MKHLCEELAQGHFTCFDLNETRLGFVGLAPS